MTQILARRSSQEVASTPRSGQPLQVIHCCVGREVLGESAEVHSEECSISQELFLPGDTVVGTRIGSQIADGMAWHVLPGVYLAHRSPCPASTGSRKSPSCTGCGRLLPFAYLSCGQHLPPCVLLCIVECTTLVRCAGKAFCARLTEVDRLDMTKTLTRYIEYIFSRLRINCLKSDRPIRLRNGHNCGTRIKK